MRTGLARRAGIAAVSQRLRPMAEQLLAESGDNVMDVLLQLLQVRAHIMQITDKPAKGDKQRNCRVRPLFIINADPHLSEQN